MKIIVQELTLLNKSIRIVDSLFSLTDLHKASGGSPKHKPANFLRLDTTQDLITEIESEKGSFSDVRSIAKFVKNGVGTFVCKELVYAYAMWISAKFSLLVIRTFDKLAQGEQPKPDELSTVQSRVPLKDAVNKLVATRRINYSDAWKIVHQWTGKDTACKMTSADVKEGLRYVHELTLSNVLIGDLLSREERIAKDRSQGVALMEKAIKVKILQDERLLKARSLINEASLLMRESERCGGAIWDGLHESQASFDITRAERCKAEALANKRFEEWKADKFMA